MDIEQFWAWMKPGFFELTLSLESQIVMKSGELLRVNPATINGPYARGSQAAFESTWTDVVEVGLSDLIDKMELQIKSPSELDQTAPRADHVVPARPAT